MKRILCMCLAIVCLTNQASLAADPQLNTEENEQVCFRTHVHESDQALTKVLKEKGDAILGRAGWSCSDAEYLFVLSVEVSDVRQTSGMVCNAAVAKGNLVLKAVSADNPEIVWHSAVVPLKAMVEADEDPAMALARKINLTGPEYVRFFRCSREKINESKRTVIVCSLLSLRAWEGEGR